MTPPALHTAGLSGDLGWNEDDESHLDGPSTAMLLVATVLYWGSLWVLAGFPPFVSSRIVRDRVAAPGLVERRSPGERRRRSKYE